MDDRHFDHLTRTLVAAAPRRVFAGALAGGAIAALLGWNAQETAARKRRRRKKRKKPATDCNPACVGNEVCVGGSCQCPQGMRRCLGPGYFMPCHECCSNGNTTFPHADCVGNPGGDLCSDIDGDLVEECHCLPSQQNCGDGNCVACCSHQDCRELTNDEFRICVGGTCPCNEPAGFFECPDGSFHEGQCRHIADDADACGPNCDRCDPPRSICGGGKCCFPSGQSCDGNHRGCCSGEDACGPGFICA